MVNSVIIEIVNYQINLYNIETLLTKHLELTNKVTSLQPNMECHLFISNCSPILLNLETRLLRSFGSLSRQIRFRFYSNILSRRKICVVCSLRQPK